MREQRLLVVEVKADGTLTPRGGGFTDIKEVYTGWQILQIAFANPEGEPGERLALLLLEREKGARR
jgi:hypothetical protein